MPQEAARRLELAREAVEESNAIDDRDRRLLQVFDDRLELHGYSVQRHEKLFRHCKVLAGECGRQGPDDLPDIALADQESAEEMVRWI